MSLEVGLFARVMPLVFGVFLVAGGVHKDTRLRWKGANTYYPPTNGQRVVMVIFDALFALYGVMGWMK